MRRDPRTDPQEGDVLHQANGTRELHVERVDANEVAYRVTDGNGGLLAAYRTPLVNWCESAPYTCHESEIFCPECDGRGAVHYIVSEYANGLERCRMCKGTGRLYLAAKEKRQ
jgi:hypothetical protein